MKRTLFRARHLACVAVLLATASAAQVQKDGKSAVQETASVTVIEVPVNVIGKDGKPLPGLTAADFELYDNGKKQRITGFEAVDLKRPAADTANPANPFGEPPPPAARRRWLLVFDLSYSSPTALIRAREGATSIVEKDMAPTDLAAVATLSVENGWKLLENFTNDRAQLAHAIDTLGVVKTGIRTNDPLAFAYLPPTQIDVQNNAPSKPVPAAVLLENLQDAQRLQQQASDAQERGRVTQQLGSLSTMAKWLDAVRGRKYVLFFSEGFESRLMTGNAGHFATPMGETNSPTQDTAAESVVQGQTWKVDSDARFGSSTTRGFLEGAMSVFHRADVILNTVDISGLRNETDVNRRAGSGTDALFTMANETNGELIRNANQLSGALAQMIDRTALVYILAFQPTGFSTPGTFHELSVKVKAPTSKVSLRSGYYEPRPFRALSPMERMLASGDLLSGGGAGQIPLHMLSAPFSSDGKVAQVPVILEIPGKELIEADSSPASQVQIYVYASNDAGTLADYVTQDMSLDRKQVGAKLEAGGIKYYGTLFLAPGRYTLRALVRNVFTGRTALATTGLTVPSIPGGEATLLPPFFNDATSTWIMVRTKPRADGSSVATDYPFAVEGESFLPAARPVVTGKAPVQVAVMTYNFGGLEKPEPLQVVAEVVGADGKTRSVDVQTLRRSDKEKNGGRSLQLTFKADGLEPGRYILKVHASDRVSRKSAESATAFEVRAP